ncbi:MAG: thioredoxin family protein [Kiritimatiellia bacterium]
MIRKFSLAVTAVTLALGATFAAETVPATPLTPAKPAVKATDKPAISGAKVGQWTMDAEAALALAKKTGKPVFLCFTGSDWCGWCKLMEKNVFSTDQWKAYVKDRVILVWIDFPQNKALVPAEIAPKNSELSEKYGVRGFPTYVILDSNGSKLGQLGASQESTPETFIDELESVLMEQKIGTVLSKEDFAAYTALKSDKQALEEKNVEWMNRLREESKDFEAQHKAIDQKIDVLLEKAKALIKK